MSEMRRANERKTQDAREQQVQVNDCPEFVTHVPPLPLLLHIMQNERRWGEDEQQQEEDEMMLLMVRRAKERGKLDST